MAQRGTFYVAQRVKKSIGYDNYRHIHTPHDRAPKVPDAATD